MVTMNVKKIEACVIKGAQMLIRYKSHPKFPFAILISELYNKLDDEQKLLQQNGNMKKLYEVWIRRKYQ